MILAISKEVQGWIGISVLLIIGLGTCAFLIGSLALDFYKKEFKPWRQRKKEEKQQYQEWKENDIVNLDNPKDWEVK